MSSYEDFGTLRAQMVAARGERKFEDGRPRKPMATSELKRRHVKELLATSRVKKARVWGGNHTIYGAYGLLHEDKKLLTY